MSASAPSDEAWAALLTQVATLQAKHASIESRLEVVETRITALEQEPPFDPSDLSELRDEVRAIVRYIARRDDISEVRVN